MERDEVLAALGEATARLAATAAELGEDQIVAPSLLPGWARGHVLTHVARNGDGLRSLLLAARSGEPLRMYASLAARDADIVVGATRPAEVIVADVVESGRRFLAEAGAMPVEAWTAEVAFSSGQPDPRWFPAERFLMQRLIEVEVHHADLGAGYTFADTPEPLAERLLEDIAGRLEVPVERDAAEGWVASVATPSGASRCRGTAPSLLGWLAGRTSGEGVSADAGTLPEVAGLP